ACISAESAEAFRRPAVVHSGPTYGGLAQVSSSGAGEPVLPAVAARSFGAQPEPVAWPCGAGLTPPEIYGSAPRLILVSSVERSDPASESSIHPVDWIRFSNPPLWSATGKSPQSRGTTGRASCRLRRECWCQSLNG